MVTHLHDPRDDGLAGPLDAKHLSQLLQVVRGRLSDREDGVAKPTHAQGAELLVKELHTQLASQQGDVLDDGEAHTPLLVLGQLDDGGQEGLREEVDANNL